eukprot:3016455-Rhodomonas_salina.1
MSADAVLSLGSSPVSIFAPRRNRYGQTGARTFLKFVIFPILRLTPGLIEDYLRPLQHCERNGCFSSSRPIRGDEISSRAALAAVIPSDKLTCGCPDQAKSAKTAEVSRCRERP